MRVLHHGSKAELSLWSVSQHNHLNEGPAGQNILIRSNSIGRTSRGDARVDVAQGVLTHSV